jgi:hypothetical protein
MEFERVAKPYPPEKFAAAYGSVSAASPNSYEIGSISVRSSTTARSILVSRNPFSIGHCSRPYRPSSPPAPMPAN